jgi:hypothetical protein
MSFVPIDQLMCRLPDVKVMGLNAGGRIITPEPHELFITSSIRGMYLN